MLWAGRTLRAARSQSSRLARWRYGRPAQPPRSHPWPAVSSLERHSFFSSSLRLPSHRETKQPFPARQPVPFLASSPAPTRRAGRLGLGSSRLPSPSLLARVLLQPALVLGVVLLKPQPYVIIGMPG